MTECTYCKCYLQLGLDLHVINDSGSSLCMACVISNVYKNSISGPFKLVETNLVTCSQIQKPIIATVESSTPTHLDMPVSNNTTVIPGYHNSLPSMHQITSSNVNRMKAYSIPLSLSPSNHRDYERYVYQLVQCRDDIKNVMKLDSNVSNVAISPLSLGIALSMLGDICLPTKQAYKELYALLISESVNDPFLDDTFPGFGCGLLHEANINSSVLTLVQAIAIIPKDNTDKFDINAKTKQLIKNVYNSEIFINTDAKSINTWAATHTQGKITQILSPDYKPSEDGSLILLNALFFKAEWENKFELHNTDRSYFYSTVDRNIVGSSCDMMFQHNTYKYNQSKSSNIHDGWQSILIPYKNCRVAAVIILHDDSTTTLSNSFDLYMESWGDFWYSLNCKDYSAVNLSLPKFKFESVGVDLSPILERAGCDSMYVSGSGVAEGIIVPETPAKVDKVFQSLYIDVNEEGTIAAGVTAVDVMLEEESEESEIVHTMTCDHPFIFNIVNMDTGIVYFTAMVNNPSGQSPFY